MNAFEHKDFAGDQLTVRPTGDQSGLIFEFAQDGRHLGNVILRDHAKAEGLRDYLGQWLRENKPKPPTVAGAVITATIKGTPDDWPHRERILTRMTSTGHVWHDADTGALYTDHEIESFEVKFEGVQDR